MGLLVVQRRDDPNLSNASDLLAFQSFAFPATAGTDQAQVAFINAVAGDDEDRLEMSDDVNSEEADMKKSWISFLLNTKKVDKKSSRAEQVMFNRVYSIDAGKYDLKGLKEVEEEAKEAAAVEAAAL